jgi:phosphopantetheine--protein transferase-like protein
MAGKNILNKMSLNCGVDILEISKFQKAKEKHGEKFLKRIYTERERATLRGKKNELLYLCLLFSFKEAVWKALPSELQKYHYFRDIEIGWEKEKAFLLSDLNYKTVLAYSVSDKYVITTAVLYK